MTTPRLCGLTLAVCLVLTAPAPAVEAPVAVSPATNLGIARVAERCPTFTWGLVAEAGSYELVVFRVPEGTTDPEGEPALQVTLPGAASAWTPSLEQCLEAGGRYAWSLRARTGKETSDWSVPTLIEVQGRPSTDEVNEALAVLQRYLEAAQADRRVADLAESLVTQLKPRRVDERTSPAPLAVNGEAPASLLPAGFETGLSSVMTGTATGTVAVYGSSLSPATGSAGVQGDSLSLDGDVAGVKGTGWSPFGWGGHFQNHFWLGKGLFAGGGPGVVLSPGTSPVLSADLVLGGWGDLGGVLDDSGTIFSDPSFPSSDLILFSNNEVRLHLNLDQGPEGDGSWFRIINGTGDEVFNVNESGKASIKTHLDVAEGTRLSQDALAVNVGGSASHRSFNIFNSGGGGMTLQVGGTSVAKLYEHTLTTGSGGSWDFGNVRIEATNIDRHISICNQAGGSRYFLRSLSGSETLFQLGNGACTGSTFVGTANHFSVTGASTHIVGIGLGATSKTYTVLAIGE